MTGPMFKGSMPALITPFKNGSVDEAAYQKFVQWQIDQGSHGLVLLFFLDLSLSLLSQHFFLCKYYSSSVPTRATWCRSWKTL